MFLYRENRFRVTVEVEGRRVGAYLPNTGRLRELLRPGVPVQLLPQRAPARLPYRMLAVQAPAFPDRRPIWVPVDSHLPILLLERAYRAGLLPEWYTFHALTKEPRLPHGRLDLRFEDVHGRVHWIEAKSVNRLDRTGLARFPDAPTVRGRTHLRLLRELAQQGQTAWVVFVVVRPDARGFAPFVEVDPLFAHLLKDARSAGVQIRAWVFPYDGNGFQAPHPLPVHLSPPPDPGPWGWDTSPEPGHLDNLESGG